MERILRNWSAHYVEFSDIPQESLTIGFDGKKNGYGVKVATGSSDQPDNVYDIQLYGAQKKGELILHSFGTAVMIPSLQNTSQKEDNGYSATYRYYTLSAGSELEDAFMVYPNPFGTPDLGSEVTFDFYLTESARVTIKIYNSAGEGIVTLVDDVLTSAPYAKKWDGRNRNGDYVAPGNYFYIYQVDSRVKRGVICFIR
jgi:hypothetical protein